MQFINFFLLRPKKEPKPTNINQPTLRPSANPVLLGKPKVQQLVDGSIEVLGGLRQELVADELRATLLGVFQLRHTQQVLDDRQHTLLGSWRWEDKNY